MLTKQQILLTILDNIRKNGRALIDGKSCYVNSRGVLCPIGLFCKNPKLPQNNDSIWDRKVRTWTEEEADKELIPDVMCHEKEFWQDMQNLHDFNYLWNEDNRTMSDYGKRFLHIIKSRWSIPSPTQS